jgi:GAF domain-containing protein
MTASVMKDRYVLVAEDVFNTPHVSRSIAERYPARSVLGVPLIAGEHKLGAAIIAFNTPHRFTSEEIEWAEQAGSQIALALWNFQQSNEIKRRLKESNALSEIGRALSVTEHTGTDSVLQLIVDSARDLIEQAEESVIHLLEEDEKTLVARAVSGQLMQEKEFRPDTGERRCGRTGHPRGITINIGNVESDSRYINHPPRIPPLLVAPASGGRQIRTISVPSRMTNAFSARTLNCSTVQRPGGDCH